MLSILMNQRFFIAIIFGILMALPAGIPTVLFHFFGGPNSGMTIGFVFVLIGAPFIAGTAASYFWVRDLVARPRTLSKEETRELGRMSVWTAAALNSLFLIAFAVASGRTGNEAFGIVIGYLILGTPLPLVCTGALTMKFKHALSSDE